MRYGLLAVVLAVAGLAGGGCGDAKPAGQVESGSRSLLLKTRRGLQAEVVRLKEGEYSRGSCRKVDVEMAELRLAQIDRDLGNITGPQYEGKRQRLYQNMKLDHQVDIERGKISRVEAAQEEEKFLRDFE